VLAPRMAAVPARHTQVTSGRFTFFGVGQGQTKAARRKLVACRREFITSSTQPGSHGCWCIASKWLSCRIIAVVTLSPRQATRERKVRAQLWGVEFGTRFGGFCPSVPAMR